MRPIPMSSKLPLMSAIDVESEKHVCKAKAEGKTYGIACQWSEHMTAKAPQVKWLRVQSIFFYHSDVEMRQLGRSPSKMPEYCTPEDRLAPPCGFDSLIPGKCRHVDHGAHVYWYHRSESSSISSKLKVAGSRRASSSFWRGWKALRDCSDGVGYGISGISDHRLGKYLRYV